MHQFSLQANVKKTDIFVYFHLLFYDIQGRLPVIKGPCHIREVNNIGVTDAPRAV